MRIFFTTVLAGLGALYVASGSHAEARRHTLAEPAASHPAQGEALWIRAGRIEPGAGAEAIEDGAVAIADGKIVAVGKASEVAVPPGARKVDYGDGAVLAPGLVAVDSGYASSNPGPRTADPTLLAIDQFDPYSDIASALKAGITTVYLVPARGRLIAGQGAVVKTGGGELGEPEGRVLSESAGLHGSISLDARSTPGYWEPPVPATVDVGLGVPKRQLPKTTMGAVVALRELFALAGGDRSLEEEYGPLTGPALAEVLEDGLPWRMGAETAGEVRAILDASEELGFPLIVDGAGRASSLAEELAESDVPVIARPHYRGASNFGKDATADWPEYHTIAELAGEGVKVAIATPTGLGTSDLRFAAGLAMRGGLSADMALAGITQNAADILGVGDRVGSLEPGKDADIVVMSGDPMSVSSTVRATIVNGEIAWTPEMAIAAREASRARKVKRPTNRNSGTRPVVISVDELHVGNGEVHTPGEMLLQNGKIAEVAPRVARPPGAMVVRGKAAMPGMIDAYGHLGTEGSNRAFNTRFETKRILEPGDFADREVAKRGVTTVNLISRSQSGTTPSIAYKPAASSFDALVVDEVATVRLEWTSNITATSGDNVRATLKRAQEYVDKWKKYKADMAKWTPPADDEDDDEGGEEDEETEDEEEGDEKKSKKKGERDPAKPVTGVFEGELMLADGEETVSARFRFDESKDGEITGSVRFGSFEDLLDVEGSRDEYDVTLTVDTPDGLWTIDLDQIYSNDPLSKEEEKKRKEEEKAKKESGDDEDENGDDAEDEEESVKTFLRGEVKVADEVVGTIDVTQTSTEYKVAKRPVRLPEEEKRERRPKGEPKEPKIDDDLEPIRRAMRGEAAVIVAVNRRDQVLECVAEFEKYGIQPILFDPAEAHMVAGRIADRIAGVIYPKDKTEITSGVQTTNKLVVMASAGIPIAFPSQAEEGAAELGVIAARAISRGLSPMAAFRGLTSDAAKMLRIDDQVGLLEAGMDADVLVLDGSPLEISSSVERVFVNGREID